MIKKALEYIVGLNQPAIQNLGDQTYSDKPLHRISHNPKARAVELSTLTSLVDYIFSEFDTHDKLFVHVVSPTRVEVFSKLDNDRERETLLVVNALVPHFNFGQFIDHESFCIGLQSKFLDADDRALLLKFAGTVEAGSVAQYGDDGVTQKATVKTGIASKGDAVVPNPVNLRAYRTFLEVTQPKAQYVFRMKQGSTGAVQCALFEADGGAWQMNAKEDIKAYLVDQFEDYNDIVVIS